MRRKAVGRLLSVLLALTVWEIAALCFRIPALLPEPWQVGRRLLELLPEPAAWRSVGMTSLRILLGFLPAVLLGAAAAAAEQKLPFVGTLLWPWVTAMRSVPVASLTVICLIWFSAGKLAAFITFLVAFPLFYAGIAAGIRAADPKLTEMARRFDVPAGKRFRCILLPQLRPWLHTAAVSSVGLCWKACAAAEVIGVVSGSVGEQLYLSKVYFDVAGLLAWTVVIILCSAACEKLAGLLTDLICGRWSRQ